MARNLITGLFLFYFDRLGFCFHLRINFWKEASCTNCSSQNKSERPDDSLVIE